MLGAQPHLGKVITQRQRREDVALDVEVAGHPGTREPQLARSMEYAYEGVGRPHHERRPRSWYVEAAAVVGLDGNGAVVAQHRADELGNSGRHALDPAY